MGNTTMVDIQLLHQKAEQMQKRRGSGSERSNDKVHHSFFTLPLKPIVLE